MNKKKPPGSAPSAESKILDAARSEFISKGLRGARMQAIAKRAGVNHALLHYYFRSKQNLYEAAVREVLATIWGNLRRELRAVPPDAHLQSTLSALLKTHFKILAKHPDFPVFMFREIFSERGAGDAVFAATFREFSEVPARVNKSLAADWPQGKMSREAALHFWLNFVGMSVASVLAGRVLQRLGLPVKLSGRFWQDRADIISATAVRGLPILKEMA